MRHTKVLRSVKCSVKFSILLLLLTMFLPATASVNSCAPDEAKRAESESSRLSNWGSVYTSYLNYAHCDDGAIWEGYSESIVRLLVRNFDECGKLCALTNKDKSFEQFVVNHIDATVPPDVLEKIYLNVKLNCPADAKHLCYLIKIAVEN